MKLSWSQKLFLKLNSRIGKSKIFDGLMYFCAVFLIYILGGMVLGWGAFILFDEDPSKFVLLIKLLLTVHIFAIGLSYLQAAFWRHPRPVVDFSDIKRIFRTIETWKSFPSDHMTISCSFAFVAVLVGAPLLFGIVLVSMALLVGFARVYCGVHYPRDIVGGAVWAFLFTWISPWLLENVAQPVYSAIKLFF